MARPKKPSAVLASVDDCARALGELAVVQAGLVQVGGRRDRAVAKLQTKYEARLDPIKARCADLVAQLEDYYYGHLVEIERDGRKHLALSTGVIGRRDNPEKLAPLNGKWTWKKIVAAVKAAYPGKYLLPAKDPDLDKEAVKRDLGPAELKQVGLKKDQDETFYVEPAKLPGVEGGR